MIPEIEALRKFTSVTITNAQLVKLRAALSAATVLFQCLEPKPGDQDGADEFESLQSDLQSALDELESACEDLESAEDKDEREDAQEQMDFALEEAISNFDQIMPVAVVGNLADVQLRAECKSKIAELKRMTPEQVPTAMAAWLAHTASPEEAEKKRLCFMSLLNKNPAA